jgi:DNA-binding MarR family transcriptional regulator
VMTMVAAQPGLSQQQLHDKTGIDPSSMVAVIDDLHARGLAERRPDPDDRRARAIFLTDEGQRKLQRIGRLAAQLQREMFGGLTQAELTTLHGLLRKLAETAPRPSEPGGPAPSEPSPAPAELGPAPLQRRR